MSCSESDLDRISSTRTPSLFFIGVQQHCSLSIDIGSALACHSFTIGTRIYASQHKSHTGSCHLVEIAGCRLALLIW